MKVTWLPQEEEFNEKNSKQWSSWWEPRLVLRTEEEEGQKTI